MDGPNINYGLSPVGPRRSDKATGVPRTLRVHHRYIPNLLAVANSLSSTYIVRAFEVENCIIHLRGPSMVASIAALTTSRQSSPSINSSVVSLDFRSAASGLFV